MSIKLLINIWIFSSDHIIIITKEEYHTVNASIAVSFEKNILGGIRVHQYNVLQLAMIVAIFLNSNKWNFANTSRLQFSNLAASVYGNKIESELNREL